MAKKRTLNEYRQTKEHYISPVKQIMAQQIDEELEEGIKEMVDKHQEDLDKASAKASKKFWSEEMLQAHGKYDGDIERDYIEEAKILIVDKITKHFNDVIFEEICKEMSNHYVFQSQNYLTEAGYEMFEDEWFEFYHHNHGDIMYDVMQNITN